MLNKIQTVVFRLPLVKRKARCWGCILASRLGIDGLCVKAYAQTQPYPSGLTHLTARFGDSILEEDFRGVIWCEIYRGRHGIMRYKKTP
jgi:hypothetical protein